MKQLVSVNLTTRTAKNWAPPELSFGETLTLALRFFKNSDGQEIETDYAVDNIKASIGLQDARPAGGKFALKVGPGAASETNTTDLLDLNIRASDLAAALNAVEATAAYGTAKVVFVNGTWLMFFGDQSQQVPLEVVNNGLWPVSFGQIGARQVDGKWKHRLRLTQAPVAFTTGHDVILPPAPKITRLQSGGADAGFTWNEIQQLYIPPEFLGAFIIKKGFAKSAKLSREESPETIQAALQALGADCFAVTLPLSQKPAIEFVGDYAGMEHDLLVPEVVQSPAGDVTLTLQLDRDELATALQATDQPLELPLEILIEGTDENEIESKLVALYLPVVIRRPVGFPELALRPTIDWLRPPSPKTYVPHGTEQILTGEKLFPAVVGDGEHEEFVVAHGLDSEVVFVFGRENISGGRQLVNGTDFEVHINDADQVTITSLTGAPALDAWAFRVFSAHTVAQWANDLTVTVPQVIAGGGYPSLPDFMDSTGERLQILEDLVLPGTPPPVANAAAVGLVTVIPEIAEIMHFRGTAEQMAAVWGEEGVDASKLKANRAPRMLSAVHDGTLTDPLPDPLPAPAANTVWVAGARTLIPGGGGIKSAWVENDGYVISDGRGLNVGKRSGETNSYYPEAFERTLFAMAINEEMLAVTRTLEILWGVQAQLVHATCKAQWVMSLQLGTFSAEVEPATLGLNLENVNWSDPVFSRAIVLSRLAQSHFFGVRIHRAVSEFLLDQQKYGNWTPNNAAAPTSANFAIRAALDRFDTENKDDPQGYVAWRLIGSIEISDTGKQTTKPAQARIY
jgi:hypothetical protein